MVKEHILTNKLFSKYISKEYPIDYRLDKKIILGLIEIGELKTTINITCNMVHRQLNLVVMPTV